jgi:hypothetical protein
VHTESRALHSSASPGYRGRYELQRIGPVHVVRYWQKGAISIAVGVGVGWKLSFCFCLKVDFIYSVIEYIAKIF